MENESIKRLYWNREKNYYYNCDFRDVFIKRLCTTVNDICIFDPNDLWNTMDYQFFAVSIAFIKVIKEIRKTPMFRYLRKLLRYVF